MGGVAAFLSGLLLLWRMGVARCVSIRGVPGCFRAVRVATLAPPGPHPALVTILEADPGTREALVDEGAADPYGAVLWPAAVAVARYVEVRRTTAVLELGAGTGLVSLTAAAKGAAEVLATDFCPLPLRLVDEAARHHQEAPLVVSTALFDICGDGPLPCRADGTSFDLVVAADLLYEPDTAVALARRVAEAYRGGARCVVGDSPGRRGRPFFIKALRRSLPGRLAIDDRSFVDAARVEPPAASSLADTGLENWYAAPRVVPNAYEGIQIFDLAPTTRATTTTRTAAASSSSGRWRI